MLYVSQRSKILYTSSYTYISLRNKKSLGYGVKNFIGLEVLDYRYVLNVVENGTR